MKRFLLLLALALPAALAARAQAPAEPTTAVRPVPRFHTIRVQGNIALILTAGRPQQVQASAATADFLGRLLTKVVDGNLQITYDDLLERDDRKLLHSDHKLQVSVTADFISMLTATGGASVQASGNFAAPDCILDLTAGATLTATGLAPNVLVVRESSGATATLSGTAPRLDVRVAGGSAYDGQQLRGTRAQLEASGGSKARIQASEELLIEADSGADVRYYGSPTVTKNVSGGASVGAK